MHGVENVDTSIVCAILVKRSDSGAVWHRGKSLSIVTTGPSDVKGSRLLIMHLDDVCQILGNPSVRFFCRPSISSKPVSTHLPGSYSKTSPPSPPNFS